MRGLTKHLEPEFFLYDAEGRLLQASRRGGRRAILEQEIPGAGIYYLFITDKGGNDIDDFGFSQHMLNKHDCSTSLTCSVTEEIQLEHLAARMPYTLPMRAGEVGILQMRSHDPSLEVSFIVYDREGNAIVEKSGSDKMVETVLKSIDRSTYLIVAYDKNGNDLGSFGMHYEKIGEDPCSQEILCETSNLFEHQLTKIAQLRSYSINGHQGEPFSFIMEEVDPAMEPYLRVYDEAGALIAQNHGSTKANIEGVFPHTGAFYILAGDKSGNDVGNFTFASEAAPSTISLRSV